jgi:hypothetical protein
MFHAGEFPFKVSYFLVALWFASWLARQDDIAAGASSREFVEFAFAISVVIVCALLGELWLTATQGATSHNDAIRSVLIYVLIMLSFGVGLYAKSFDCRWLIPVFYVSVALNLGFIFLRTDMPSWLVDLYYSQRAVDILDNRDLVDVRSVLEMARPRGLFGNPNVSALMVNIIVLFIHLSIRNGLLRITSVLTMFCLIVLPLVLATFLASRGEFIVAVILAFLNFRALFRASGPRQKFGTLMLMAVVSIGALTTLSTIDVDKTQIRNVERIVTILGVLDKTETASGDPDEVLNTVNRPLFLMENAWDRFKVSPMFGTGFSVSERYPFDYGTQYYHNDWFRLLVTSGLVGFIALLYLINRFCLPLGWTALIPFVLPGMVNTFQLNIPAFMFYFFMVAVLREKLRERELTSAHAA